MFVQISAYKRNGEWYDWLNANMNKFSAFTYYLIMNYEKYRDVILSTIAELKKALVKLKISDRVAENWAIVAGSFYAVIKQDKEFIKWVNKVCQEQKISGEDDHALNQFWNDVNYLIEKGKLSKDMFLLEGNELAIWYPGVYEEWALHYRSKTGKEPFDKNSIAAYVKEEPYYIDTKNKKINNKTRWAWIINIEKSPNIVKELADSMRTMSALV
ncbi:MAG: hypothetical protein A4E56_03340 [Pelotomaculum sp. PtaU1.Bin065]|nr:MAG: hypothetical protein A4E56_03340 [Pelotomaculum sp. PtaU1.Bin065]